MFDALVNSEIDCYVDYTGTIWVNYMKREKPADPQTVLEGVTTWLRDQHGITCLGTLGFENAYGLAMRRELAEQEGITSIGDLAAHAAEMAIGGDYEFFGRPEWAAIKKAYGLRFADQISYDSTFMYEAVAQGDVQVISAFTSDGRIAAYDLVVLDDPKNVIPPYDAVLLLGPEAGDDQRLLDALKPLIGEIDVETMRRANYQVDREQNKRTVNQAAHWLRQQCCASRRGRS